MTLNPKECAILGLISQGSIHGYELMNMLRKRGYEEWTELSLPSVYRIVGSLEGRGYLVSQLDGETQGAPKKIYSITEIGIRALAESLLNHLEHPVRSRSSFDLAIAHVGLLDSKQVQNIIRERLEGLHKRNDNMQKRWQVLQPLPWNVEALFVHGEQRYKAEVFYLEYLIKRLEEG